MISVILMLLGLSELLELLALSACQDCIDIIEVRGVLCYFIVVRATWLFVSVVMVFREFDFLAFKDYYGIQCYYNATRVVRASLAPV